MSLVKKELILFQLIFIFFIILTIFVSFHLMKNVTGQGGSENTTVNVTIGGNLDDIIVQYLPVNFTVGDIGIAPGVDDYPKQNIQPFLNVSTGVNTNVRWNISINATNMTDGLGNSIPVNEIKVNYTCYKSTGEIQSFLPYLIELSYDPRNLCGYEGLEPNGYVWIYFFLDVPAGQYNSTYYGNIWIYADAAEASPGYNNKTWYGPGNTTAKIKTRKDIKWTLTPIMFGLAIPNTKKNATENQGWPTNITIGAATNIQVDLYINGTDLIGSSDRVGSHNITYSNATSEAEWPFPYVHTLNNTLPDDSTGGDFANWGNISRNTDVFSYWEMTVPNVPGGAYYGDVVAKVVDTGYDPTQL